MVYKAMFIAIVLFNLGMFISLWIYLRSTTSGSNLNPINKRQIDGLEIFLPKISTSIDHQDLSQDEKLILSRKDFVYAMRPWKILDGACRETECMKSRRPLWSMILLVKSYADHQFQRELIRRTWGLISFVDNGRFEVAFVIGESQNSISSNLLIEENKRFGDLLQYKGSDSKGNDVLKTLAGMQWALENFPDSYFYSAVNENVMVNMKLLQESVDSSKLQMEAKKWPTFPIICGYRKIVDEKPVIGLKWTISANEYKWKTYPTHCQGGLYTTSMKVVKELFYITKSENTLRLDDVWITGILRSKMGMQELMLLQPTAAAGFYFKDDKRMQQKDKTRFMRDEWKRLLDSFKGRSILCICSTVYVK